MSLKVKMLKCDKCRTSVFAFPLLPSVYCFPSGEVLRMRSAFGWCETCQHIRQVEALPSLSELDAEEAGWLKRAQAKAGGLHRYEQREQESIGLYRRLLHLRQHSSRCLGCGGLAVDAWRMDADENFVHSPHGGCAGRVHLVDDPDGMRILLLEDAEAYSLEGEHLGRLSEQPGYGGMQDY